VPEKLTPLQVRHAAALKLVAEGELDGMLALSLVVWPPKGSRLADDRVPVTRQFYPPELKAEIRERFAAGGETYEELAEAVGVPYATVKSWLSKQCRERDARRQGASIVSGLPETAI
jgi:DNA invertase Pin-like site-specific DNA recombinase